MGTDASPDHDADLALVAAHPLVAPLDERSRRRVLESVELRRLSPGTPLIQRGDPPGPLVLVLRGAAVVCNDEQELGRVAARSWVGELSVLEDRPDRHRVEAVNDMLVAVVDAGIADRLLRLDAVAAQVDSIARRRRAANRASEVAATEVTLRDGGPLWLRPLVASDWEHLAAGDGRVSERSLRMRFFTPPPRTESRFREMTDVDLRSAFAWAAFVDDLLVGVGRHALQREEPDVAELAVLVADAHQRRGIGRVLIEAAMIAADVHGATELLAVTRADNHPIHDLLADYGASFEESEDEGVLETRWPLADALARLEQTYVHDRLRAVAEVVLAPVLED